MTAVHLFCGREFYVEAVPGQNIYLGPNSFNSDTNAAAAGAAAADAAAAPAAASAAASAACI